MSQSKIKSKNNNENNFNEITVSKIQREILYANGCNRSDISNYRHGKFHYIKKTKIKMMKLVLENEIIDAKDFIPFAANRKNTTAKYYLVIRGIK